VTKKKKKKKSDLKV